MPEHVILFAGPMGAGKTTAIRTLSEIDVVSTEAANTDRLQADKDTTTVALDYGEIAVGLDDKIRLYGVPGQSRFDFMWTILQQRAMGLMLLIHADAPNPVVAVGDQLGAFLDLANRGGLVIGITRSELGPRDVVDRVRTVASALLPERSIPVFAVDARDYEQMRTMLMALISDVEERAEMMRASR
ncbi:GTP-binding protein [Protaetiibacter mangrovi]|uniref:ATP/GTP-binding protein n=1 Tax=Protaetiibacter mangrovi TaxID=2970926 RepID=A0ABT1ZEJ5_9MICO|nr:ATP/GTP-binding protein [Protaetiibacter mangrovi]MCS0499091.1 ATP/GTP-binding protein [Protaetiibacter mangrovi]TPX00551.1 ATP-binding protein [Schumannella luteola]